jgi:hypothetical protein
MYGETYCTERDSTQRSSRVFAQLSNGSLNARSTTYEGAEPPKMRTVCPLETRTRPLSEPTRASPVNTVRRDSSRSGSTSTR